MRKICLVVAGDVVKIGGLEAHVLDLCRGFVRQYQVSVVAHANIAPYLPEGVELIPVDLSRGRFNLALLFSLWRLLRSRKFDIVHAHANKACAIVALLKPFCRFHFVATLHGQKKNLRCYSRADHVITVSSHIAKNVKNDKLHVIYNGIVPPTPLPGLRAMFGISPDDFLFCALGRLVPVKGFDLLLRALVDVPGKLLILGDGPEEMNLKHLASRLGLEKRVLFGGYLKDAASYLIEADAVVISSHREGFSYAFAEALINGKPLISTNVADVAEFIGRDFIVPVGDVNALAERMTAVAKNRSEVMAAFKPVFLRAKQEFSLENMISQTAEVYETFL